MFNASETTTTTDRLVKFVHESYGLALTSLGLTASQVEEAATTVNDSLANNFDWEGEFKTFRFTSRDGSDEEPVSARNLADAALHIAADAGWFYDPEETDDDGDDIAAVMHMSEAASDEQANEERQYQHAIQATEDAGIAEWDKAIELEEAGFSRLRSEPWTWVATGPNYRLVITRSKGLYVGHAHSVSSRDLKTLKSGTLNEAVAACNEEFAGVLVRSQRSEQDLSIPDVLWNAGFQTNGKEPIVWTRGEANGASCMIFNSTHETTFAGLAVDKIGNTTQVESNDLTTTITELRSQFPHIEIASA